jgi:hypothetical protein
MKLLPMKLVPVPLIPGRSVYSCMFCGVSGCTKQRVPVKGSTWSNGCSWRCVGSSQACVERMRRVCGIVWRLPSSDNIEQALQHLPTEAW